MKSLWDRQVLLWQSFWLASNGMGAWSGLRRACIRRIKLIRLQDARQSRREHAFRVVRQGARHVKARVRHVALDPSSFRTGGVHHVSYERSPSLCRRQWTHFAPDDERRTDCGRTDEDHCPHRVPSRLHRSAEAAFSRWRSGGACRRHGEALGVRQMAVVWRFRDDEEPP